jgi:hypothetical protein
MGEIEEEALADVAYGLFEILLNNVLSTKGSYLFELVESRGDFREEFEQVFAQFQADYPQLTDALLTQFGSKDALYQTFSSGEGVIPSKTTRVYWIHQDAPGFRPDEIDDEKMGKWLVFLEEGDVDETWRLIRDATCQGRLGITAKVSTAKPNPESRDERKVVYVYTRDWEDEEDVMRIREELRTLGVEQRIGYKRNIETYQGEYSQKGKKVTYYSA